MIEIFTFCAAAVPLLVVIKSKPELKDNKTIRLLLSATIIAGFVIVLSRLWTFAGRGHPIHVAFPFLFIFCAFFSRINNIFCFAIWPLTTSKSRQRLDSAGTVEQDRSPKSVVVMIPTLGEPLDVLEATFISCKAMDYENFAVVVLDDSARPAVKDLAHRTGCSYIARPSHDHAKAGNLNFGLKHTESDFIALFDADCVPHRSFLQETMPYFVDPTVGIVQTPQFHRTNEPLGRLLALKDCRSESDVFYRFYQPIYDLLGSAICCGTACVFRRASLTPSGGFFCRSSTEDYYTGIRVTSLGYRLVYIYKHLSTGLPAATLSSYLDQRKRWARGTMQGLRTSSNPLLIDGLSLRQRLGHLLSILSWTYEPMMSLVRHTGIALAIGGTYWFVASWQEIILGPVPVILITVQLARAAQEDKIPSSYALLRSRIVDEPVALSVVAGLLCPKKVGFKVTRKDAGGSSPQVIHPTTAIRLAGTALLYCWGLHSCLLALWELSPILGADFLRRHDVFMASSGVLFSLQGVIMSSFALAAALRLR
jgi:cellulose synthase (UDP-forming)